MSMSTTLRLKARYDVTGIDWFDTNGGMTRQTYPRKIVSGFEVAAAIAVLQRQIEHRQDALSTLVLMLNEGETADEKDARIAGEDADPEAAARAAGWTTVVELKLHCENHAPAFANWLPFNNASICRPRWDSIERITNKYPERCQHFADHLDLASSWQDALDIVRRERTPK